jgi:hypothetical protein
VEQHIALCAPVVTPAYCCSGIDFAPPLIDISHDDVLADQKLYQEIPSVMEMEISISIISWTNSFSGDTGNYDRFH